MKSFKTVDDYIDSCSTYKDIAIHLRAMLQNNTDLEESIKWGIPAYCINGKNVLGFGEFKNYLSLWFHQGVFLKDKENRLVNAQEEKTKGMRQWRIHSIVEFKKQEILILDYILEAIENQKAGKEIKFEKKSLPVIIPDLLVKSLNSNQNLKAHFEKFSPSKQREFCEFIETAKRDETKKSRLQKITGMIIEGVALNDKYR